MSVLSLFFLMKNTEGMIYELVIFSAYLACSGPGEDMQLICHNARALHTSSLTQGFIKGE